MRKVILFLIFSLLLVNHVFAGTFLAKEKTQIIKQSGDCKSRHSPCSTFKIAISLMVYNEGILKNETYPELPFKEGYVDSLDLWKQPHNPITWIKNSCVWYSQVITHKLGIEKFKNYVINFNYGNKDVSGNKGKNDGLTNSWLSSSLQISAEEQVEFLQKLLDNALPVDAHAHEMTRNILFVEDFVDGWKLYGKTGSGCLLNQDGTRNPDRQIGWFVGWITKDNRTIVFAKYIEDTEKQDSFGGKRAKEAAKEELLSLIKAEQK
jgi:beta-lactamase class D